MAQQQTQTMLLDSSMFWTLPHTDTHAHTCVGYALCIPNYKEPAFQTDMNISDFTHVSPTKKRVGTPNQSLMRTWGKGGGMESDKAILSHTLRIHMAWPVVVLLMSLRGWRHAQWL